MERPHEIVGRNLADERAAPRSRLDDSEELQRAQRLADRCPRDLELLGERALGGKLIAGPQLALLKERFDLLDNALVEPAAPDGLDYGQFDLLSAWSGGLTRTSRGYDG
jgi:hypothetical protein